MAGKSDNLLLSTVIAQKIDEMIVKDGLQPGTKLPSETELARWYRVSRPTIREAMKTLEAKHVVMIRQGDGTYIREKTGVGGDPLGFRYMEKDRLSESVFEARLVLEPKVVMLAAQRADQNDIERMRAVVEQMQNVRYQEPARLSLDLQFHGLIAESSKNPVFKQMLSVFYEAIEAGIVLLNESGNSFDRAQKAHRDIFQAICRRDACRAMNAMADHIYSTWEDVKEADEKQQKET